MSVIVIEQSIAEAGTLIILITFYELALYAHSCSRKTDLRNRFRESQ